jgi:putative SOS response-associated peptidase YedK
MCGRAYSTVTDDEMAIRYSWIKLKRNPMGLKPNYNLSPTQLASVVLIREDEPQLSLFRFGLVPAWCKDVKSASKYSLINARGEEIETKRSYAAAFKSRRCIIPLSGFIEWKRDGEKKRPFAIHLNDDPIMSVAGIYEHWESKETGEVVDSFSIVTTAANSFMEEIHDRMPVILGKKDEEKWLDPANQNVVELKKFLKPCPSAWLESFEVSTLVNSPKNNSPEVLLPVKKR